MKQPLENSVTIEIVRSKSDLKKFIKIPHKIYQTDPHWVAPLNFDEQKKLNRDKHPFFARADAELFIAYTNGEPVGRIAAILDHKYVSPQGIIGDTAYWGFFESLNDSSVAHTLFNAANEWAKEKGSNRIIGPLSPSANDLAGLLVDGFNEPPMFMMSYNPEYYINLVEGFGHQKYTDLYAWQLGTTEAPQRTKDFAKKIISRLNKQDIIIRPINMKDWDNELEKTRVLFNEFEKINPIYTPMTADEFAYVGNDMKMIIDPKLVFMAEKNGKPIGVSLTFPDINQLFKPANGKILSFVAQLLKYKAVRALQSKSTIDSIRVTSMGLLDEYKNKGIDQVFYHLTGEAASSRGIKSAEFSWVDENNAKMNNIATRFDKGVELNKTYRVYQYDL